MGYSRPKNCFLPLRICWAIFFMSSFVRGHFFATTENSQISKFTKYGHVIYHLICLLMLINKISQKITKNVFPTNYINLYDLSPEIYMFKYVPYCTIPNVNQGSSTKIHSTKKFLIVCCPSVLFLLLALHHLNFHFYCPPHKQLYSIHSCNHHLRTHRTLCMVFVT